MFGRFPGVGQAETQIATASEGELRNILAQVLRSTQQRDMEKDQLLSEMKEMRDRLRRLEQIQSGDAEDWIIYRFRAASIAASTASTLVQQTISADWHFYLFKVTGIETGAYGIRVTDTTGQYMTADAAVIDYRNFRGTSVQPYELRYPRRFEANSTITVEYREDSAATNTIEVCFHGIRVRAIRERAA